MLFSWNIRPLIIDRLSIEYKSPIIDFTCYPGPSSLTHSLAEPPRRFVLHGNDDLLVHRLLRVEDYRLGPTVPVPFVSERKRALVTVYRLERLRFLVRRGCLWRHRRIVEDRHLLGVCKEEKEEVGYPGVEKKDYRFIDYLLPGTRDDRFLAGIWNFWNSRKFKNRSLRGWTDTEKREMKSGKSKPVEAQRIKKRPETF